MKKEDIAVAAQLLEAIRDDVGKIEEALKKKDGEQMNIAKKEILEFKRKLDEIL